MADHDDPTSVQRFAFAFDPTYARVALPFGIRPSTAEARVDGRFLDVRFGPWRVRTTLGNVVDALETGPYAMPFTIGPPHLSFRDRGLTFATNQRRGVCLTFAQPVRGLDPLGLIRHPGLTVTVEDPEAFIAAVTEAAEAPPLGQDPNEQAALDRLHTMTASELRALAGERGIDHQAARQRDELVALLEADLGDDIVDELPET